MVKKQIHILHLLQKHGCYADGYIIKFGRRYFSGKNGSSFTFTAGFIERDAYLWKLDEYDACNKMFHILWNAFNPNYPLK